jgi:hypothetical protein
VAAIALGAIAFIPFCRSSFVHGDEYNHVVHKDPFLDHLPEATRR